MEFGNGRILPVNLEQEMRNSYIDYAMSVIVSRALPDVRDGLKPVHRRILYAMQEAGMTSGKPYKKSARIVGEVLGKYHPHGDSSVYDAIVRMAQDFSMRYMLADGHGNFGSVDGDPPAAMRYTEVRMAKIAELMLQDIDKDTVDFVPNYDESLKEPSVLPSKFPELLVNGTSGIAVGMATNIPPHNMSEVIDGVLMLIDNPDASVEELMTVIKGPDFPTQHKNIGHITGIRRIDNESYMRLDRFTVRSLELVGTMNEGGRSLLNVIDDTTTPMGGRLMHRWLLFPLIHAESIRQRLNIVEYFFRDPDMAESIEESLHQVGDMERIISKVAVGRANPREIIQLRVALSALKDIKAQCENADSFTAGCKYLCSGTKNFNDSALGSILNQRN